MPTMATASPSQLCVMWLIVFPGYERSRACVILWHGVQHSSAEDSLSLGRGVRLGGSEDLVGARADVSPPCLGSYARNGASSHAESRLPTALLIAPVALQPVKQVCLLRGGPQGWGTRSGP